MIGLAPAAALPPVVVLPLEAAAVLVLGAVHLFPRLVVDVDMLPHTAGYDVQQVTADLALLLQSLAAPALFEVFAPFG